MQRTLAVLLTAGLALAPFGMTYAQNPQPAPPGDSHPRTASPSAPSPPPEKLAHGVNGGTGKQTLSDKLSRQNGTLTPPETGDRDAVVQPKQQAGNMPVLRPPGTPGGNQKVVPK